MIRPGKNRRRRPKAPASGQSTLQAMGGAIVLGFWTCSMTSSSIRLVPTSEASHTRQNKYRCTTHFGVATDMA
uniref:Uncharacterized protein n=1 Tax=uncultured alpha proteobacterium HF0130_06E21 TaxID=710808 RepID=E0XT30_9PROT|nr:hypothetical protein [uncultured alpha proteobacterium HF0130_06E21]